MGDYDNIGTFASGSCNGELIADTRDILNDYIHVIFGFELSAQFSKNGGALFVSPNAQGTGRGSLCCCGASAKHHTGNQKDCDEHYTFLHWFLL